MPAASPDLPDSTELSDLPDLSALPPTRWLSRLVDALPADADLRNAPRPAPGAAYTPVTPTPVRAPRLLAWSDEMGKTLGLARPADAQGESVRVLAGNALLPGMKPYAARYGGHQFGHWAGQLGDGRAITLGELQAPDGGVWELQLKGAGPTPYARHADGRAVLRSSLREFVCSEAMFHLGIPSTRALSLVATGETVERDMFYDGHPEFEPGAVVCRVAPSFIRFGNFQIHASLGETEALRRLVDFTISQHFPAIAAIADPAARLCRWYAEVGQRTATLVAHWMRVGFVHGVMNTDNLSILGLTIDYGPYGWLDVYDPAWTPNTTDAEGRRYCFARQPGIAAWNLARLGEALLPLTDDQEALQDGLDAYARSYDTVWRRLLADKLGLVDIDNEADGPWLSEMLALLRLVETDMSIFFRRLADVPLGERDSGDARRLPLAEAFYADAAEWPADFRRRWSDWLAAYAARARHVVASAAAGGDSRRHRMDRANPARLPRNYLVQQCIDALAAGDATPLERLMASLRRPYDDLPEFADLAGRRPEWARDRPGCATLSCSS